MDSLRYKYASPPPAEEKDQNAQSSSPTPATTNSLPKVSRALVCDAYRFTRGLESAFAKKFQILTNSGDGDRAARPLPVSTRLALAPLRHTTPLPMTTE
jgi:hypothetical protein